MSNDSMADGPESRWVEAPPMIPERKGLKRFVLAILVIGAFTVWSRQSGPEEPTGIAEIPFDAVLWPRPLYEPLPEPPVVDMSKLRGVGLMGNKYREDAVAAYKARQLAPWGKLRRKLHEEQIAAFERSDRLRLGMARSLLDTLRVGMTVDEVKTLIGEPRLPGGWGGPPDWFRNFHYRGPTGPEWLGYYVGDFSNASPWRRLICLYFDDTGRLVGKDLYWRLGPTD